MSKILYCFNPFNWYVVSTWPWMLRMASKFNGFPIWGLEYVPFMVIVDDKTNKIKINHEVIHHYQQVETLFVFWYLLYIFEYAIGRMKGKSHLAAYENIHFEKEAYKYMYNLDYLKTRPFYNWIHN